MRLKQINKLNNGKLLFAYWANNRGRGDNNCTLVVVPANTIRPAKSKSLCDKEWEMTDKEKLLKEKQDLDSKLQEEIMLLEEEIEHYIYLTIALPVKIIK